MAIESAAAGDGPWQAIVVFAEDPMKAYGWTLGTAATWLLVLKPTNLDLVGSDFSLHLDGVQNNIAKLRLQEVPVNGIGCAITV